MVKQKPVPHREAEPIIDDVEFGPEAHRGSLEYISGLATELGESAEQKAIEAETAALHAHFASLIDRAARGEEGIKFYYAYLDERGEPTATGGRARAELTDMSDTDDPDIHLLFHFNDIPHTTALLGSGWIVDHNRRENPYSIRFGGVQDVEFHEDTNHVTFRSERNSGPFTYVITDENMASATATEIARGTTRFTEESQPE